MAVSLHTRERFLIALARFLGANPTEDAPLEGLLVCDPWQLEETVRGIAQDNGTVVLTKQKFDQLMLCCGRRLPTQHFYDYFFKQVATISGFEEAIERFRVGAALLFGNFKFAYRTLATSVEDEFADWTRRLEPSDGSEYTARNEFSDIAPIPEDDLYLLGYVSSELSDLDFCLEAIKSLRTAGQTLEALLAGLGAENQRKVSALLAEHGIRFPATGREGLTAADLSQMQETLEAILRPLKERCERAQQIGGKNTHRYLTLPYLDVYVATSMRTKEDYKDQARFIREVFQHPDVKPLKLRYFDPTLSYSSDRITKGLIECLMIRRARVTLYNAGIEDTFGKDSECAASLAQGKPVIVYVPESKEAEVKQKLDKRADTFREFHPLGLQIDIRTGVAHGVIVVRSSEDCAKMLAKVLLRKLNLGMIHKNNNHLLVEKETQSVLRVITDDRHLTHSFWTYFRKVEF